MSTFEKGIEEIKNKRKAYQEYVEMNRENGILNLVSRSMNRLVTAQEEQESH